MMAKTGKTTQKATTSAHRDGCACPRCKYRLRAAGARLDLSYLWAGIYDAALEAECKAEEAAQEALRHVPVVIEPEGEESALWGGRDLDEPRVIKRPRVPKPDLHVRFCAHCGYEAAALDGGALYELQKAHEWQHELRGHVLEHESLRWVKAKPNYAAPIVHAAAPTSAALIQVCLKCRKRLRGEADAMAIAQRNHSAGCPGASYEAL
jgi:hypothetical protein